MASDWFAVKTLYRSQAEGRPEKPDLAFDPDATLFEERVLLFKAKSASEAVSKAEREAKDFAARNTCVNPYQQKIATYYMGFNEVFKVGRTLADKTEVLSTARFVSRRIGDKKIAQIYMGRRFDLQGKGKTKKFMNKDYDHTRG